MYLSEGLVRQLAGFDNFKIKRSPQRDLALPGRVLPPACNHDARSLPKSASRLCVPKGTGEQAVRVFVRAGRKRVRTGEFRAPVAQSWSTTLGGPRTEFRPSSLDRHRRPGDSLRSTPRLPPSSRSPQERNSRADQIWNVSCIGQVEDGLCPIGCAWHCPTSVLGTLGLATPGSPNALFAPSLGVGSSGRFPGDPSSHASFLREGQMRRN